MNCPECGHHDATLAKTIHYPRGTATLILDCPHCVRLVLQDARVAAGQAEIWVGPASVPAGSDAGPTRTYMQVSD